MPWFRNTKRLPYPTLRATGREIISQWPLRTDARNDVQGLADEPGGDAAWSRADLAATVQPTGDGWVAFFMGGD